MNNIFKIITYVYDWQSKHDKDFQSLPVDSHSALIFNHENQIYKFLFSNKHKRDECRLTIPFELIENYNYMIEQEDGFTYYLLKGTSNDCNDNY